MGGCEGTGRGGRLVRPSNLNSPLCQSGEAVCRGQGFLSGGWGKGKRKYIFSLVSFLCLKGLSHKIFVVCK